ncbi:ROK family protein [Echinicola shivajiensis]|uniref:ROK family protein n=1 Tax=Echinicola shivajiensis TaxID=1035916 RepID=UPI001FE9F7D9|nr:ROK family protein [Echinicola shivajiensis]
MSYSNDKRTVMTLDAGGTNFVFSAIQGNKEILAPITKKASPDDLEKCLTTIKKGFHEISAQLKDVPVAISFAFPGPADYEHGIIGDLPNFPCFRGGVALGPMLEAEFGIPVFINNDGSLFAYGEALAGCLPEINKQLESAGNPKRFKNLLGITLGTGFGGGAVVNKELLIGDNGTGGDVWVFRNKKIPDCIIEESVSIRAIQRVYGEFSGDLRKLSPEDIFYIAEGKIEGDQEAAVASFKELGEMAGDTIAQANTILDGIVVIGGGLIGAAKYILPAIITELNGNLSILTGEHFPRSQAKAYDLSNKDQLAQFLNSKAKDIPIPGTSKSIPYTAEKLTGIMVSKLGASKAISLGAYAFALHQIDS